MQPITINNIYMEFKLHNIDKPLTNLTWDYIHRTDKLLKLVWEAWVGDYDIEYTYCGNFNAQIDHIRMSCELDYVSENFFPTEDIIYPLKSPTVIDTQLLTIFANTNNIVIIKHDDGTNYISTTHAGDDVMSSIAYAYLVIDGEVPINLLKGVYK